MAAFVISGDETLIGQELGGLVDRLVGDNDRSMMVDSFDCADPGVQVATIVDSLSTVPMFTDRRVVVLRSIHSLSAANGDPDALVRALAGRDDTVDVVVTVTGRLPKALADALKDAEKIGVSVGNRERDRIEWVEVRLVESGLSFTPDVPKIIATWLGEDNGRLAGLIQTLVSAHGEGARLTRPDVEAFLGDAGGVSPWDLTNAIDDGDTRRALVMLHRFLGDGRAHPLQLISALSGRYEKMMRLDGRDPKSKADAVAILGGNEYAAQKVLEQYRLIGGGGVARAMSWLADADVDLRGGKDWPPELVMEVLVGRLCRLAPPRRATSRRASS